MRAKLEQNLCDGCVVLANAGRKMTVEYINIISSCQLLKSLNRRDGLTKYDGLAAVFSLSLERQTGVGEAVRGQCFVRQGFWPCGVYVSISLALGCLIKQRRKERRVDTIYSFFLAFLRNREC